MILKSFSVVLVALLVSAGGVPDPEERIVGGRHIFIEDAPYQVSILKYDVHHCGGSIYSDRIILTAAHCLNGTNADNLSVRAGSSLRNLGGQVVDVQKAYPHEDYNYKETGHLNDIAVLYLKEPLKLNTQRIQKIELAKETPKTGENCTVTGWGYTFQGSKLGAPSLLAADLTISDQETCRLKYYFGIKKGMICAEAPGKDSCQGDSGGPLVSFQSGKLIGIVSFGEGCAQSQFPGVYANVAHYKDWILKAIGIVQK